MKILVFNGSPHKGNTWRLTQRVIAIIKSFDESIEFNELHLTDLNLPFCTGCSSCFRNGHKTCPHNKSLQPVMDMIEASDAIIFSVSCFQGHLPGILKNFTDHMAFMLHRPRYFNKKALIISTTGGVAASATAKALAATLAGWGFNKSYLLPIRALSWNAYEPDEKDLKKARKSADRFYKDVRSGKMHPPSLGVLIPFNLFQAMYAGSKEENAYPTEDNVFWPKYKGMRYAPGIPLPFHKRIFASLIYYAGKSFSRNIIITYKK